MPLYKQSRSPFWWYSFTFQGRRHRASTEKTTKSAAAVVEAEARAKIIRGELPVTPNGSTLRTFSVRFLAWAKTTTELQPNTRRYYEYGCRLLNLSPLADRRMDSITTDEIGCTTFRINAVPCSTTYTLQALRTLKVMFGKAVEWKLCPYRPRIPMPKAVNRDMLINDHVDHTLDRVYNEPIKHKGVLRNRRRAWTVIVCIEDAGMRPDEVFPMRIEHLDFVRRQIWVPEGKTPKAKRFVNMTDRMSVLLKEQVGIRKDDWVFPSKGKSGHLTTIAKGFQAARNRGKLAAAIVPYSGRHTFGTFAMEKTGNVFAVSKAMGHGSIKSMEPYQHPNPDLDSLNEAINERNRTRDLRVPSHTPSHTEVTIN